MVFILLVSAFLSLRDSRGAVPNRVRLGPCGKARAPHMTPGPTRVLRTLYSAGRRRGTIRACGYTCHYPARCTSSRPEDPHSNLSSRSGTEKGGGQQLSPVGPFSSSSSAGFSFGSDLDRPAARSGGVVAPAEFSLSSQPASRAGWPQGGGQAS